MLFSKLLWLETWLPIYCTKNEDCPDNLSCLIKDKECRNPCNSTGCKFADEIYSVKNHVINCTSTAKSCTEQKDCPDTLDCLEKKCRSPCDGKKCDEGKICVVQNHKDKCESINEKNNKTELGGKGIYLFSGCGHSVLKVEIFMSCWLILLLKSGK
ncbi:uncharacterized protein LOC141529978 isoform X2 [Cotesia typhae]|uniref:uncharacterized protein LOC141529978 isoform X2 n=1 Tax=Cotesia typhae TaxID=2053667 RepID=UPI003D69C9BC